LRLAQRFPVRIHVDQVPAGVVLAMAMTCTVNVGEQHAGLRQAVTDVTDTARQQIAALRGGQVDNQAAQALRMAVSA